MATQTRGSAPEKRDRPGRPAKATRITPAVFLRQIVAELRKVIWPTRKELGTYTTVALVRPGAAGSCRKPWGLRRQERMPGEPARKA
jgi:hypothetical protein